jgi:chromosome segregation ATPase
MTELERELAEARAAAAKASQLESDLREAVAKQQTADAALTHAQERIAELGQQAGTSQADQDRIEDALAKISDRDREIDSLRGKADAADLAIGRASALQRQLDEALAKLSYLERDLQGARGRENKQIEQSDPLAAERVSAAEGRAKTAEGRVAEAERRAAVAEESSEELERRLVDAGSRIAFLEREVATADNVRSFAANTEREIARLERELRDARTKIGQLTADRDQLAADLRESRGDTDTTSRRAPLNVSKDFDAEVTAQADVSKYETLILKAQESEKRLTKLESENQVLKAELIEAEKAARAAEDRADDPTRTGEQLPVQIAEHVAALEESIDSLRANMRAASDETAMMDPTDSVQVVVAAVSQAAEHVERARAALRALASSVGL